MDVALTETSTKPRRTFRRPFPRAGHLRRAALRALLGIPLSLSFCLSATTGLAAPQASFVIDARNGAIYSSDNADERLHPASLTKMMTLYLAFEAVERGEISMDTPIRVSANAASEIPTKLGLVKGQTIQLRYLVRAAAVKSANDAATAIAEGISGSEDAFVDRMNRTARALGMSRTTFRNAHGLTEPDHLSTARDMAMLGRHLIYDYPQYYNLFSRLEADAGVATVEHTNRRFLSGYPGADGIKTGYTRASGFNLVASAERGGERIIAAIFGAPNSAARARKAAQLIDQGFAAAPSHLPFDAPEFPEILSAPYASLRPVLRPEAVELRAAPIAGGFSYAELMARRKAILQGFDPVRVVPVETPPAPDLGPFEPARGGFAAVDVPRPGMGRIVPAKGPAPSQVEIFAAATATITELRKITGLPEIEARGAHDDAGSETPEDSPNISRAGMTDFERAVEQGSEIEMDIPRQREAPETQGQTSPEAPLLETAPPAPLMPKASERNPAPSIFNIESFAPLPTPAPDAWSLYGQVPLEPAQDEAPLPDAPSQAPGDDGVPSTMREALEFLDSLPLKDRPSLAPASSRPASSRPDRPEPAEPEGVASQPPAQELKPAEESTPQKEEASPESQAETSVMEGTGETEDAPPAAPKEDDGPSAPDQERPKPIVLPW